MRGFPSISRKRARADNADGGHVAMAYIAFCKEQRWWGVDLRQNFGIEGIGERADLDVEVFCACNLVPRPCPVPIGRDRSRGAGANARHIAQHFR